MKNLQSCETFQFLWWNYLIRQNETKYAVFSKPTGKLKRIKNETAVAIKYVTCGKVRLFVQFGSWVDLKVGSQNLHGELNSYVLESWSN